MSLAAAHQRSQKRDLFSGKVAKDQIDDLFVGMMYHHLARYGRIGFRSTGEKQAQKVVDLRNGTYRRTGILVRRFLLDRDDRTEPRDLVDVGTLHRADELASVSGKRLHIASLPLGIDRVESERRLAGTRQTGDDGQFIARNLDVDVLRLCTLAPYTLIVLSSDISQISNLSPDYRARRKSRFGTLITNERPALLS